MEESCPSCPVCGRVIPLTGLERHVNSHLDEAESARDHALALELASTSHPFSMQQTLKTGLNDSCSREGCTGERRRDHAAENDRARGAGLPSFASCSEERERDAETCTLCNEVTPLEEWESHKLMHEIQAQEYMRGYREGEFDCALNDEENATKKARKEQCAGTSVTEPVCISNIDMQSLALSQRKGNFRPIEEGIINLIRDCFYSENRDFSCTVMSDHIDHFESRTSEDVGWGCGWRNIQMLSSHLLTHPWGKERLFGGAGFVPDILSLQRWLEFAWALGFDEPGAEFYNFQIHGSKEWIGTAECAALFRSFGLRARIVDFSTIGKARKGGQSTIDRWLQHHAPRDKSPQRKRLNELPVNTEIHHNVQCDVCGVYPIKGTRFKSKERENYDLCSLCILSDTKPDDYEKLDSSRTTNSKKKEVASDEDVNHESLVKWVWSYFTSGIEDAASKARIDLFQGHVAASGRTPLYFQHQGHSRTIVGMQRRKKSAGSKEEVFLLVLDPSTKTEDLVHALTSKKQWQKLIKRGVHTLKKRSYQVCYVEPGAATGEELQQLKILRSEQIFY